MIKLLAGLLGGLAALALVATAGLFAMQRALLFRPDSLDLPPETLGLTGARVHRITADEGVSLVAWFVSGQSVSGKSRRLILFLHGTGGSLVRRAGRIGELTAHGPVLAIDYRGFGGSTGTPSEAGLVRDAQAAYGFARAAGFAPDEIVVVGESLGSGLALRLAAARPVGGVVLAGAYRSIRAVAAERYWMVPVGLGLRDPFDVAADLPRVRAPVLVLHGGEDRVIPLHHAEALVAGAEPGVTFAPIEGAAHLVLDDATAAARLDTWLAALPATGARAD